MIINKSSGPPPLLFHFQKGVISHGMCQAKGVSPKHS